MCFKQTITESERAHEQKNSVQSYESGRDGAR